MIQKGNSLCKNTSHDIQIVKIGQPVSCTAHPLTKLSKSYALQCISVGQTSLKYTWYYLLNAIKTRQALFEVTVTTLQANCSWYYLVYNSGMPIFHYGTETVQITPLRTALASSPLSECARCLHRALAGSKTLFQQNPPVLNWGCRLTLHNGPKTVACVCIYFSSTLPHLVFPLSLFHLWQQREHFLMSPWTLTNDLYR